MHIVLRLHSLPHSWDGTIEYVDSLESKRIDRKNPHHESLVYPVAMSKDASSGDHSTILGCHLAKPGVDLVRNQRFSLEILIVLLNRLENLP